MSMDNNNAAHRDESGRWHIWDKATGACLLRWPVDARLLVEAGSHTLEPPAGVDEPENDLRGHVAISKPVKIKKGQVVESLEIHRVENEYSGPVTPKVA